jgi:hypothetical protein
MRQRAPGDFGAGGVRNQSGSDLMLVENYR